MKTMKRTLIGMTLVAAILGWAAPARAAGWAEGTVGLFGLHAPGTNSTTAYFSLENWNIGSWGCANGGQFRFDAGSAIGKNVYSLLLAAKMSGKRVYVYHDNSCYGGYPGFSWLQFQ